MEKKSDVWYLEETNMYKWLCPHRIAEYKDAHKMYDYKKGDYIYMKDDPSSYIYLVVKGKIKILDNTEDGEEYVKAILAKGDVFGEMVMAGEERRKDYARAVVDTTVCPFAIENIDELLRNNRNLSIRLYKILGLRIKKLERKVTNLVFKDARARIIDLITEMAEEQGKKVGSETMITNYLTHKDIATLTGTSRQTVTTILNDLKAENQINFNRRQILIRDLNNFH
jgi:CRP-like cAMP-binding protein